MINRQDEAVPGLRWNDPLPRRPRRVLVAGCSGSGKSTLAGLLAARWGVPHHELDALYHGPDWVPRPEFTAEVATLADSDAWVAEWQYAAVRPMLLARADLVVWLDLPRWLTYGRLLRRTVRRRLRRVELWNGNTEPPLWTVFADRDHILRYGWSAHPRTRRRMQALLEDGTAPPVVRLRSPREVRGWLDGPVLAARRPSDP
jgi:adenylate kinase family enzyme